VQGTIAAALDTGDLIGGAPQREQMPPMEQMPMEQMPPEMMQQEQMMPPMEPQQ
jgi:hypothetical protein